MTYIGLDFDNTIAIYDDLFTEVARQFGWYTDSEPSSKRQVRDSVRALENGEEKWQCLQAEVYGPQMGGAKIADGFLSFLEQCQDRNIEACIISHKTAFANKGDRSVNLRDAALDWMNLVGLISEQGAGIRPDRIYFSDTREDKISRIAAQNCTHFVDDLEEIFDHPAFPDSVVKYHYVPGGQVHDLADYPPYTSWNAIGEALFGN